MTAPEPLSSSEARRIATTLLANLVNVRFGSPEYGAVATAALAYATLAPQLGPSQAEQEAEQEAERKRYERWSEAAQQHTAMLMASR